VSKKNPVSTSFKFALEGLKLAFLSEPNFRVHTLFAITVLILALILGFNLAEWTILLFTISFVIVMELFNTAVEAIVDLVSPEIKPKAKIAKDVAAAAVLISAMVAVIIGFVLFIPKIFS